MASKYHAFYLLQIVATCIEIIKFLGNVWIKKSGAPKIGSKIIIANIWVKKMFRWLVIAIIYSIIRCM